MAIKDKLNETTAGQGFGPQPAKAPQDNGPGPDAGQMVQLIQNSAVQKVASLVTQFDQGLTVLEDAGAQAIIERGNQTDLRVLDKVAAGVVQRAQTDTVPNSSKLGAQLTQVLMEVNRSDTWRTCSADDMTRSNLLFASPEDAMKQARQLPGA